MSFKHLNIEKPCSQKWEEMTPIDHGSGRKGRHCASCNHVVNDFSELSTTELVEMLQNTKHSCGMFSKDQLGTMYYVNEETQTKRKKYWSSIAAAIVAGTLQLTTAYSQNPVRTNKLYNRNLAIAKYNEEKLVENQSQENTTIKKEKFNFKVLDAETREPLQYTKVEMMGMQGITDSLGRIDFDFAYQQDTLVSFFAELSLYKYEDEHVKLHLQACYKKLTVLYMRKKKESNRSKEVVFGFY